MGARFLTVGVTNVERGKANMMVAWNWKNRYELRVFNRLADEILNRQMAEG